MRPLQIQHVCGKDHHYVVWNRICVTRRRKEGKSGLLRGQTIESRFLLSQSLSKRKMCQRMVKTLKTKISQSRRQPCMSIRRKPCWREASQPVPSRPLRLGDLRKCLNFAVLPLCRGCTTLSLIEVLSGINYHPI